MNTTEFLNQNLLDEWPNRVCLPYDVDLLQLARWVAAARECEVSLRFEIFSGGQSHLWSGPDAIDLFNEIHKRCLNFSLSHSYVVCAQPRSIMFFDMYGRFVFFAADLKVLQRLYPFSCEIMWENFIMLQEGDDVPLAEVFRKVTT